MSYSAMGASFPITVAGLSVPVDIPIEQMAKAAIEQSMPEIQAQLEGSVKTAAIAAGAGVALIIGAVFLSGWWFSKKAA